MDYSAKQEQGHTAVGVTAESPAIPGPTPNAPESQGTPGPTPQTSDPWPGRSATIYAALDESAQSYGSILEAARQSPGAVVTTATTTGAANDVPRV